MTSGVLVCIKNKTAFLKKEPHFTFTKMFSVGLDSVERNRVGAEQRRPSSAALRRARGPPRGGRERGPPRRFSGRPGVIG